MKFIRHFFLISISLISCKTTVDLLNLRQEPASPVPGFEKFYEAMNTALSENYEKVEFTVDGTVIIKFIISKEGELTQAYIFKGVKPDYDSLALNIIRNLPVKWNPAYVQGKFYAQQLAIPLFFDSPVDRKTKEIPSDIFSDSNHEKSEFMGFQNYDLIRDEIIGKISLKKSKVRNVSDEPVYILFRVSHPNKVQSFFFLKGNNELYTLIRPQLNNYYREEPAAICLLDCVVLAFSIQ